MHSLTGIRRPYAWGSTSAIQELLGLEVDGSPLAEVWFGAHPTGPSTVHGAEAATLDALIAADPTAALGEAVASRYDNTLPFLLKFLAPGQPVSLQVHPAPEAARAGFERENRAGVPIEAFHRTYKDTSHKPEMVFALTDFEGLVGLRPVDQILHLLGSYRHSAIREAHDMLGDSPDAEGARRVLAHLVQLPKDVVDAVVAESKNLANASSMAHLHGSSRTAVALTGEDGWDRLAFATVVELAKHFAGDAGTVASLLLNRVTFAPGQAVFVASGVPHAYIRGLAVEVMANSDNVIRAGLTGKYVDVDGLITNTAYDFGAPDLVETSVVADGIRAVRPPVEEFEVYEITATEVEETTLETAGPRVAVCVDGDLVVTAGGTSIVLSVGHAVFVADADGPLTVAGSGRLVVAGVPVDSVV